jgi:hypothetical protein
MGGPNQTTSMLIDSEQPTDVTQRPKMSSSSGIVTEVIDSVCRTEAMRALGSRRDSLGIPVRGCAVTATAGNEVGEGGQATGEDVGGRPARSVPCLNTCCVQLISLFQRGSMQAAVLVEFK